MSAIKKYIDIQLAMDTFNKGGNVTEALKKQLNTNENSSEIIEIAYDLQAGSYIDYVEANLDLATAYAREVADIVRPHLKDDDILLDAGTGELTTLSLLINQLNRDLKDIYAFDISWSRIWKGLGFAQRVMAGKYRHLKPFVADIDAIPLRSKSIDITVTSHALEPNGGREKQLLEELFRITKRKLLLCEPCYEINSAEGRQRMEKLGYIKDLDSAIRALGGDLVEKVKIRNVSNPLNPTVCYIITPPQGMPEHLAGNGPLFSDPGSDNMLTEIDGTLFSSRSGFSYPKIKDIPILRANAAVLTTALENDPSVKKTIRA